MIKQLALFVFLIAALKSYSQTKGLDTVQLQLAALNIDNVENEGKDIVDFIVSKENHRGYRVNIHYIVDTVSKKLLKCGFYEHHRNSQDEVITKTIFYFDQGNFFMAKLFTSFDGKNISKGTLFFQHQEDKIVVVVSSAENNLWDLARIQARTDEFKMDFSGIVNMIERKKHGR